MTIEFGLTEAITTSAWEVVEGVARPLSQALTLLTDRVVDFRIKSIQRLEGDQMPLRRGKVGGVATIYNLAELTEKLRKASEIVNTRDPALEKSLAYFHHATLLKNMAWPSVFDDREEDAVGSLLFGSEAFLNYWKAATAIVGDRTKGDDSAERTMRLGLSSDYYPSRIEPLRQLRNDYDVAHYDVELDRAKEVGASLGRMIEVAKELLIAYSRYLQAGGTPFSPRNP